MIDDIVNYLPKEDRPEPKKRLALICKQRIDPQLGNAKQDATNRKTILEALIANNAPAQEIQAWREKLKKANDDISRMEKQLEVVRRCQK